MGRRLGAASAGQRIVRLGVRLAAAGLVLTTVGSLASYFVFRIERAAPAFGTLVMSLLVTAGVLASSRLARVLAVLQAIGYATALVIVLGALHLGQSPRQFVGMGMLTIGLATFVVGTVLANLTPAAREWHAANSARARRARKASSLAEWRGTPAETRDA